MTLEIGGRLLRSEDVPAGWNCVWCGRPAAETGYAPGLDREVPLHPLPCAAQIIIAYKRWLAGAEHRTIANKERIERLLGPSPRQLTAGG